MKRYSISNKDQTIDYEIRHRPAVTRRIHLEINDEGDLRVIAPRRMSRRAIHKTLQQRAGHVARFLIKARARQRDLPEYLYTSGEKHLFMGRRYPLEILEWYDRRGTVCLVDERIQVVAPEPTHDSIRNKLENWYRQQAQQHFTARLALFSQAATWTSTELPPMRLRRMKRTWGSCSSKGVITLNPHLVKAPAECIDYVIAHEVCHLREHNHGKAFYALQEQLYPGWREAKARLGDKGHIYLHRSTRSHP
jgi:predicted metal-dependent hydrolase